jgi:hypothetical protein
MVLVRWIVSLLLLGALAPAGEVEDRIGELASEDYVLRRRAHRWLQENAERSRPALEQALTSRDAEVRAVCRRLLLRLGWVDPMTRKAVTPQRLEELRSADPQTRKRAAMSVALSSRLALEGLHAVYRGHVATLRLEPARNTVFAEHAQLPLRVTNADTRPGWVGSPTTSLDTRDWKPFGRTVTFPFAAPAQRSIGIGGGAGCFFRRGRQTVINQADRFQWLAPGQALRDASVPSYVSRAGRYRARVSATFEHRSFDLYHAGAGLPRTTIRVDCPESADSPEFEMFAIPTKASWGKVVQSTQFVAIRERDHVRLRVTSDGATSVPRDFSSAWYLVLDEDNQLIEHGTVGGRPEVPSLYLQRELVKRKVVEHRIALPKRRDVAVLFGMQVSRGTPEGLLVISNRLPIPR